MLVLGFTISGDGTTNKHLNYESKHITIITPTYTPSKASSTLPVQRFIGINSAVNHTSKTQLEGWKETVKRMYETYNCSLLGCYAPANPLEFAQLTTGMNTDHAKDQKKLVRLFQEWKDTCNQEICGEDALLLASMTELIPLLWSETEKNIEEAGGIYNWEELSAKEQKT